MAAAKITKIEMPKTKSDWGVVQINNFSNTYYRFEMLEGKPKLNRNILLISWKIPKKNIEIFHLKAIFISRFNSF